MNTPRSASAARARESGVVSSDTFSCGTAASRRGPRSAEKPLRRFDAISSEAVALLAEPLDLFDQHLPLVTGLLEDLLGGVLGSCADLVSSAQRAGQGVAYGRIELLVDRDALVCGIELRFERADALGELADTIGERADDVAGRA